MHPTEIAALKCMDGRLNLALMAKTPLGIISPFRNIGGKFNLGWPFFQHAIDDWRHYSAANSRDSVVLATYHFSAGSVQRGCKGHGYDTKAAKESSLFIRDRFNEVYGGEEINSTRLFALPIGIETDSGSFVLNGEAGEVVEVSGIEDATSGGITNLLSSLYPSINGVAPNVIRDLVPLVLGNFEYSRELRESGRGPQAMDHRESVLAIGRGFDWLHEPDLAIIIGPWDSDLLDAIENAAYLISHNLEEGRFNGGKVVLLTSGTYRDHIASQQRLAALKSRHLHDVAMKVITAKFPRLIAHMEVMKTTVNLDNREIQVID